MSLLFTHKQTKTSATEQKFSIHMKSNHCRFWAYMFLWLIWFLFTCANIAMLTRKCTIVLGLDHGARKVSVSPLSKVFIPIHKHCFKVKHVDSEFKNVTEKWSRSLWVVFPVQNWKKTAGAEACVIVAPIISVGWIARINLLILSLKLSKILFMFFILSFFWAKCTRNHSNAHTTYGSPLSKICHEFWK